VLCWIFRLTLGIWAYMYNSKVAFFHLLWVLASFFVPTSWFYHVSVFFFLPLVCFEFSLAYISCIKSFQEARVF